MANKKFSQFTAQAPSAATSYIVGYDSSANDNIRFQEGDLNLADMGGAVNLATQTSGTLDLATQVTGVLLQGNGGTGATSLTNAQEIGRKLVASTWWTSGLLNVPRGAEYTLPFNSNQALIRNHNFPTVSYAGFTALPVGVTQLGTQSRGFQVSLLAGLKQLFKITLRLVFYDQTADLDIQGGFYSTINSATWTVNLRKYLLIKDSANEASDYRVYEGSAYFEVPALGADPNQFFVPWVRFDNGSADPFPYYNASEYNGSCQFTIEQIY